MTSSLTLPLSSVPVEFIDTGLRLGFLVCMWVTVVLVVITAAGLVAMIRSDSDLGAGAFMIGLIATVVMAGIWAAVAFPFDYRYRHNYSLSGNVTSVSNVLDSASGDLTRTPVLVLDTLEIPVVVDDARAVSLEGRDVELRCTVGWNYQAADTYSCRIVSYGAPVKES